MIFWLTNKFPSEAQYNSNSGMFIYRTVKELANYYPITVICFYPYTPPILSMLQNIKDYRNIYKQWKELHPKELVKPEGLDNINVIYIKYIRPPRGRLFFLEGWFAFYAVKGKIKNLLSKDKNLFHANWLFPVGKATELLSRKFNIPYIITLRGSDINLLKLNSINWKSALAVLKNSSKITSVSPFLLRESKNKKLIMNENKLFITHNFYDTEQFKIEDKNLARKNIKEDNNIKLIFYAGGLDKLKNVDILIKSIYSLPSTYSIKLLIAGSGYEENNLRSLAFEKNISNQIVFLGELDTQKIIDYYNAADLFCLVSKSEGLPNVIVESLLCGTPVIASSVGGIPNLIQEGINGYLVEPNSVSSLVQKIKLGFDTQWNRNVLRESVNFIFKENVINEYNSIYKGFN